MLKMNLFNDAPYDPDHPELSDRSIPDAASRPEPFPRLLALPDQVTVLTVRKPNGRATKRHRWDRGRWVTKPYDAGKYFDAEAATVSGIRDIGALIECGRNDRLLLIIRGGIVGGDKVRGVRRKYKPDKETPNPAFYDVPRQWLMVDVDGWTIPGAFDLVADTDVLIERAVADVLPAVFHDVVAFWQLSASAGINPGLRVHIWFWLDRIVATKVLRSWMQVNAPRVDASTISPEMPHYVADPIIQDGPTQFRGALAGLLASVISFGCPI